MLYIVLILVLAALGLVVAALITANSLWAWISIGLSVLAGVLLVADWLRRRSSRTAVGSGDSGDSGDSTEKHAEPGTDTDTDARQDDAPDSEHGDDTAPVTDTAGSAITEDGADAERTGAEEAGSDATAEPGDTVIIGKADDDIGQQTALLAASGDLKTPTGDPAEEQTDAADLLVISELDTEVLVVDEYPRYHLAHCAWLEARDTIPIAVKEARELGFTPCARCGPDARIAAGLKGGRGAKKR
ncbi:hypothetical protein ABZ639_25305 [Saccharomonospora sp. NPDC006951]